MAIQMPDTRSIMIDLTTISTPHDKVLRVTVDQPVDPEIAKRARDARIDLIAAVAADGSLLGFVPTGRVDGAAGRDEPVSRDDVAVIHAIREHVMAVEDVLDAIATHGVIAHAADPDDRLPASWFGIVTAADLNKPLFGASVYTVIARFESAFGQFVMDLFGDDWQAIGQLNEHSQRVVKERYEEFRRDGIDLSPVVNCSLDDLFWIARRTGKLANRLGYLDPDDIERDQAMIDEVRNRIMHPVQPLIPHGGDDGAHDIADVRDTIVRLMQLTRSVVENSK